MAYPRFAAREAVFHKRNAGHNVRHFDYTGELFYFRGQCTRQPCLHGYLVTAARGGLCASGTCFAPTEAERRPNIPLPCSAASLIFNCLPRGIRLPLFNEGTQQLRSGL